MRQGAAGPISTGDDEGLAVAAALGPAGLALGIAAVFRARHRRVAAAGMLTSMLAFLLRALA